MLSGIKLGTRAGACALAACAVLVGACGSDDKTDTSTSNSAAKSTTVDTSQAQSVAKQFETRPTAIPMTQPIDKPIPTGKNITFINCGVTACAIGAEIVKEAAQALGWTVTAIGTDGSPQQIQEAFASALRKKTDAIAIDGTPRAVIEKQIAEAQKQGVPIAAAFMTDPASGGVISNTGGLAFQAQYGRAGAAYAVTKTNGDLHAVAVILQGLPAAEASGDAFVTNVPKFCSSCTVDKLEVPLTAIGKDMPDRIVSYLRSHPKVNFVALTVADSTGNGLPAALQAAGLKDKVQLFGAGGAAVSAGYVQGGQLAAYSPVDYYNANYGIVDALARHFAGVAPDNADPKVWVVDKDTLPSPTKPYPLVTDTKEQFLKLWGKSGS
jgi:ABC-type sugar transport system substrate-binding protein